MDQKIGILDRTDTNLVDIKDVVNTVFEKNQLFISEENEIRGVRTGVTELDDYILGLEGGQVLVVAGKISVGKTSFILNLLKNISIDGAIPTAFFSLESAKDKIVELLIAQDLKVPVSIFKQKRFLDQLNSGPLHQSMRKISQGNLFIDDTPGISVTQMITSLKLKKDLKLIVIDNLNLVKSEENNISKYINISEVIRELKNFAREINVPIIITTQLSKEAEKKNKKNPDLLDIKDSYTVPEVADIVLLMKKNIDIEIKDPNSEFIDFYVSKNRFGSTGSFKLGFRKNIAEFVSLDKSQQN